MTVSAICCHTGRPGDIPHIAGCPLCEGVIARRAASEANVIRREARVRLETRTTREASRCPVCAFLTDRNGHHAPNCIAAAGPETERLIRFLEARS